MKRLEAVALGVLTVGIAAAAAVPTQDVIAEGAIVASAALLASLLWHLGQTYPQRAQRRSGAILGGYAGPPVVQGYRSAVTILDRELIDWGTDDRWNWVREAE